MSTPPLFFDRVLETSTTTSTGTYTLAGAVTGFQAFSVVGNATSCYYCAYEVDANGKKYNGKVDSIAGASGARFSLLPPENATGNYVKVVQRIPVKIVLDAGSTKDHQLRPGMSVTPKIWIRE